MRRESGSGGLKERFGNWLKIYAYEVGSLWYYKTWGSRFARAGVPDYLLCSHGRLLAIELKSPEKRAEPSAKQAHELNWLKRAGALTLVTNSLEEAQAFVRQAVTGFP